MADSFGLAYYKAQEAAGAALPVGGSVLLTVTDQDKGAALEVARIFKELDFEILTTEGTHAFLSKHGVNSQKVKKFHEGRPNIVDSIKNEEVDLSAQDPGQTRTQAKILDATVEQLRKRAVTERALHEIPEVDLERLRALGYIGG